MENVSIRVQLDITGGGEQVGLIHRRRGEASLPQIAAPALAEIHLPGITPMGLAQGRAQTPASSGTRIRCVVGHQAIRPHRHPCRAAPRRQQSDVAGVILFAEEHRLAVPPE